MRPTTTIILPIYQLLLYIIVLLLVGHLCLSDLINPVLGYPLGFGIILFLLVKLLVEKYHLDYCLILFACSHFYYGNNHGGLWNYLNVFAILIYSFIYPWWEAPLQLAKIPAFILKLLFILNAIGLLFIAESSTAVRAEGFLLSLSYGILIAFLLRLPVSTTLFNRLFFVLLFICIWSLVIAVNQKGMFIDTLSPLLPKGNGDGLENNSWEAYEYKSERADGPFKDFELFAEYSSLLYTFFFPFLFLRNNQKQCSHLSVTAGIVFFSLVSILMTATRSSTLLLIPVTGFYLMFYRQTLAEKPSIIFGIVAVSCTLFMYSQYIGMDYLGERIKELNINQILSGSARRAEAINRSETFEAGLKRLAEKDWLLGYGYGVSEHYSMAFFGKSASDMRDFHSLYLSLPIMFGWLGAGLFLVFILYQTIESLVTWLHCSHPSLQPLVMGMTIFWCVFLLNELKIQAIREPNYFMIIWFWLGFSTLASRLVIQNSN